jgi:hypothetical protein
MSDDTTLIPLYDAFANFGVKAPCNSTVWRWVRIGMQGANGERIRLPVTYVGRKVYTTQADIRSWMQAVTEARYTQHGGQDNGQATIR